MMMKVTSHKIDQQIAKATEHIAKLSDEARELAFQAVTGDADAAKRLAEISAEIERSKLDLDVFENARTVAVDKEYAAAKAYEAGKKAEALKYAKSSAVALLEAAGRVDRIIGDFLSAIHDLAIAERDLQDAARSARIETAGHLIGRRNIVQHAYDALAIRNRRIPKKNFEHDIIAEVVRIGWSDLLPATETNTESEL